MSKLNTYHVVFQEYKSAIIKSTEVKAITMVNALLQLEVSYPYNNTLKCEIKK